MCIRDSIGDAPQGHLVGVVSVERDEGRVPGFRKLRRDRGGGERATRGGDRGLVERVSKHGHARVLMEKCVIVFAKALSHGRESRKRKCGTAQTVNSRVNANPS